MAYLAFILITTLSVQDIDFFVGSRQTLLPIINVSIPTFSFFVFAPILGAALYAYLHLHICKLTEALAETPTGTTPLEEQIKPWLLNDYILRQRRDYAIRRRPMDWLVRLATAFLVWWLGPIVLGVMWVRTWPAHELRLSLLAALCLMIVVYAGTSSWAKMRQDLRRRNTWSSHVMSALALLLVPPVVWLTLANSKGVNEWIVKMPEDNKVPLSRLQRIEEWARKVDHKAVDDRTGAEIAGRAVWMVLTDLGKLDSPDLTAARLSVLPQEEVDHETARYRYRLEFCDRRGIGAEICDRVSSVGYQPSEHLKGERWKWCQPRDYLKDSMSNCEGFFSRLDGEFENEWSSYRKTLVDSLPKPDLRGKDLRRAVLLQAELSGIDFRNARLESANLSEARMESANLEKVLMPDVNLRDARLQDANLRSARLQGADLRDAWLQGADLRDAWLQGADLRDAWLQKANLLDARMERVKLIDADMRGVQLNGGKLRQADMQRADLRNADLRDADMREANLRFAEMHGVDLGGAELRGARLAGAKLHGVDAMSEFDGVELFAASLEASGLRGRLFRETISASDLRFSNLKLMHWDRHSIRASLVHHADMRGGKNITQGLLSSLIGNPYTLLPEASSPETLELLYVPSCWIDEPEDWSKLVEVLRRRPQDNWLDNIMLFKMTEEEMRVAFLCDKDQGEIPRKTGTPWPLDLPPPWETDPEWQPEDRGFVQ